MKEEIVKGKWTKWRIIKFFCLYFSEKMQNSNLIFN